MKKKQRHGNSDLYSSPQKDSEPQAVEPLPRHKGKTVGFQRTPEEEKTWNSIKEFIGRDLELGLSGSADSLIALISRRIEEGFSYKASLITEEFNPLHVEPILDDAINLLDRGVRDRAAYDDLASKSFLLYQELVEYIELDAIHKEEEDNGIYDVNHKQSLADYEAEKLTATWQGILRGFVDNMRAIFFMPNTKDVQLSAVRRAAMLVGKVYSVVSHMNFVEIVGISRAYCT